MLSGLILAIEQKRQIQFTYSGERRTAYPAIVGVASCGNQVLYCFQTEGCRLLPGNSWIQCKLNDIKGLIVSDNPFHSIPSDNPFDYQSMLGIYAKL